MPDALIKVVLPMGGASQRFKDAGVMLPKSLLPVDGTPMFIKALSSLTAAPFEFELTAVVRSDFDDHNKIRPILDRFGYHTAKIATVDHLTRGAVETVHLGLAQQGFLPDQSLIVLDTDLYFESEAYWKLLQRSLTDPQLSGVILYQSSDDPRFSFVRTGENGAVIEIVEKVVISDQAVIGSYFFSRCEDFFRTSTEILSNDNVAHSRELYISGLIAKMIARGANFQTARADRYDSFGTPEELKHYESLR